MNSRIQLPFRHPVVRVAGLLLLVFVVAAGPGLAQDVRREVDRALAEISAGHADAVRDELPGLLTRYPNNPGIMYVQGLVTREGTDAVRLYQSIVDNFPKSEWADDALYKTYQFYYALGLYRTAELKMQQLKKEYPSSPYLQTGTEPVPAIPAIAEAQERQKDAEISAPATGQPAQSAVQTPVPPPVVASEPPAVQPSVETAKEEPPHAQRYVLQVGAYGQMANASKQKMTLEGLGYPVEIITKMVDTRSLYTVTVGSYTTVEEARVAAAKLLKKHRIATIVISR